MTVAGLPSTPGRAETVNGRGGHKQHLANPNQIAACSATPQSAIHPIQIQNRIVSMRSPWVVPRPPT